MLPPQPNPTLNRTIRRPSKPQQELSAVYCTGKDCRNSALLVWGLCLCPYSCGTPCNATQYQCGFAQSSAQSIQDDTVIRPVQANVCRGPFQTPKSSVPVSSLQYYKPGAHRTLQLEWKDKTVFASGSSSRFQSHHSIGASARRASSLQPLQEPCFQPSQESVPV